MCNYIWNVQKICFQKVLTFYWDSLYVCLILHVSFCVFLICLGDIADLKMATLLDLNAVLLKEKLMFYVFNNKYFVVT